MAPMDIHAKRQQMAKLRFRVRQSLPVTGAADLYTVLR